MDGTWYLISGENFGEFHGYKWTGSVWESDPAIVLGLGDIGQNSAPTVFNKDEIWYLISGDSSGGFHGYKWTGSAWESDSAIISGLPLDLSPIQDMTVPEVFNKDGTWYLISGEHYGGFYGFRWYEGSS